MVKISTSDTAQSVCLLGHGIKVNERHENEPDIFIEPLELTLQHDEISDSASNVVEYAGALAAIPLVTFQIEVLRRGDTAELVTRAWNALWLFYLISLACRSPCFPLISMSDHKESVALINRNVVIRPLPTIHEMSPAEMAWAKKHAKSFDALARDKRFSHSMIAYGNAQYFVDHDSRIMLLWAGIEGLLGVEHELNFRIPLYLALLAGGSADEKYRYFSKVKDIYTVRSRVVHGATVSDEKRIAGFEATNRILVDSLARCVEIGCVPTAEDFTRAAVSGSLEFGSGVG